MAKKAKRRGRPPGSKNKKSLKLIGIGNVNKMDVAQLRAHIDGLHTLLGKKINEHRAHLEHQLSQLGGYGSEKAAPAAGSTGRRKGKRAKAAPKYQSKKDKSLKWSGRGMTPIWMRDEMKGTKLTKDSFLIK
jgi:DNA-binding protein H-NS